MTERGDPRLNPPELQLPDDLSHYRRLFFQDIGNPKSHPNLDVLIHNSKSKFEGKIAGGAAYATLLVQVVGRPTAGKTEMIKYPLTPALDTVVEELQNTYQKPIRKQHLAWDRVEKKIFGDQNLPLSKDSLEVVNAYYDAALAYMLGTEKLVYSPIVNTTVLDEMIQDFSLTSKADSPFSVITTEKPDATILRHGDIWIKPSRIYAPTTAMNIHEQKGPFQYVQDNIDQAAVCLVSGPTMEYYAKKRTDEGGEGATRAQLDKASEACHTIVDIMKSSPNWGNLGELADLPVFVREVIEGKKPDKEIGEEEEAFKEGFVADVKAVSKVIEASEEDVLEMPVTD